MRALNQDRTAQRHWAIASPPDGQTLAYAGGAGAAGAWVCCLPFADAGGGHSGGRPDTCAIECYVTPFDVLRWYSAQPSKRSDLFAEKTIGISLALPDFGTMLGQYHSFHSLYGDFATWRPGISGRTGPGGGERPPHPAGVGQAGSPTAEERFQSGLAASLGSGSAHYQDEGRPHPPGAPGGAGGRSADPSDRRRACATKCRTTGGWKSHWGKEPHPTPYRVLGLRPVTVQVKRRQGGGRPCDRAPLYDDEEAEGLHRPEGTIPGSVMGRDSGLLRGLRAGHAVRAVR